MDTVKQLAAQLPFVSSKSILNGDMHVNGVAKPTKSHPFDPLTGAEIATAVSVIQREYAALALHFNTVTLREPPKASMLAWLADNSIGRPHRIADIVAVGKGSKVYDGLVDLNDEKVTAWECIPGVQPLITVEDLQDVEKIIRKDPKVIEQCKIIGIDEKDMDRVFCDPWTIGFDERWGSTVRLQQALMYYRPSLDDSQYTYALDFTPIFNASSQEVVDINIPEVRRPLSKEPPSNFHSAAIEAEESGFMPDLKPINVTQPDGVSFKVKGHEVEWAKWKMHVGFNHREGIVLNDIKFQDEKEERSLFYRLSLAEMVVPYGNGETPHHRKHAFDLGEYGAGYMTNSLTNGCDCKGTIHYMDADFVNRAGSVETIKNAICLHEEDGGLLFKHTDFRDNSCTVTRARKFIISQIFTAANYEYMIYWIFHLDGTIQLEIKLSGILNTAAMNPDEDLRGEGTCVYPGVNAHNHQHLFCLRIDPNLDSSPNSVIQVDAMPSPHPVGHPENKYGNVFTAQRTKYTTVTDAISDYDSSTGRTWDICNESRNNPYSGKPVAYKLISREVPRLLPKEGSLVWKRAGFARHALHVTPYSDSQHHPAGRHVPQTSGDPSTPQHPSNTDLPAWIAANPEASVADTDVVLWHTFGLTHFPAPEDYPVMPAEPVSVLLRPRNFFKRNPALDVRPSSSTWPSKLAARS